VDLPLAGGTMTGNILFGTDNTYTIGSNTKAPSVVFGNDFDFMNSGTGIGQMLADTPTDLLITDNGTANATITLQPANGQSVFVTGGALRGTGDIRGQAATAGSTSVGVSFTHTLSGTPVGVSVTPLGDPTAGGAYWVTGLSTTGFTINTSIASTLAFSWIVIQ